MNKNNLISIVLPTYNRSKTIKKSVDSILNQTYSNFELIIVDDCSTDNTSDIINNYYDKRIKYYKFKENKGACAARNYGINKSKGDLIAFQDSDDEWLPNKLQSQYEFLIKSGSDINFCSFYRIINNRKKIIPSRGFIEPKNYTSSLLIENFISTQTLLCKKKVFDRIMFDEGLPRFQDWDLVIRLSKEYKISFLNEPLVNVYVQKDSISKNPIKGLKSINILYKKYKEFILTDEKIKNSFDIKRVTFMFYSKCECKKELLGCLKNRFNIKIFIFYLLCIFHLNNVFIKLKK